MNPCSGGSAGSESGSIAGRGGRSRSRSLARGAGLGSVAAVLLVAGCSGKGAGGGAPSSATASGFAAVADGSLTSKGSLTVQLDYDSVETDGLDPQNAATARTWAIESLVYEPLVTVGPQFQIEPDLAASWKQPDATTYVFTLRPGVKFSNGRLMTTADVVGSIKRLLATKSAYSAQLGPVKSVAATGPEQVTVTLAAPYTPFLSAMANTPAAILPMKEVDDHSLNLKTTLLGTGPYVVSQHVQDQYWTFAPNPYYRDAAKLSVTNLKLQIVPQDATRLAAIRSGSAGMAFFGNVDATRLLAGSGKVATVAQRNSDFYYLILNSLKKGSPLLNQKIRFAINSAIDRTQIASTVFAGDVQPTGVTPSVLPGACNPAQLPSAQAGTANAATALAAAGGKGITLHLATYTSEPAIGQIAQVIQQQLAKIGVTVVIDQFDDATYTSKVFGAKPDFDMALGWYAGYGDPTMVSRWWNPVVAGFSATFLTNDQALDNIITQASQQAAGAARDATMTKLCDQVDTDAEMLPLVTRPTVLAYRTDQVSPTLFSNEGYGNILRSIVDFKSVAK